MLLQKEFNGYSVILLVLKVLSIGKGYYFRPYLRNTLAGLTITNFKHIDDSYCDDVQTLSEDVNDLIKFDQVMKKFESTSGAILSRNKKSKVMGLGLWKGKQHWPEEMKWMKIVTEMKIFGFMIC